MLTLEEAKEALGLSGMEPKFKYSRTSYGRLKTCVEELQIVAELALYYRDFSVVTGHRDKATQERMYREKKSKAHWGQSKHNSLPSKAIDLVPYGRGLVYDMKECAYTAGLVQMLLNTVVGVGNSRNGGDWDSDFSMLDTNFKDPTHFELTY